MQTPRGLSCRTDNPPLLLSSFPPSRPSFSYLPERGGRDDSLDRPHSYRTRCLHTLSGAGLASAGPVYPVVRVRSVAIAMYPAAVASSATSIAPTAVRLPRTHVRYLHRLARRLCLNLRTPPLYLRTLRLIKPRIPRIAMLFSGQGRAPSPLQTRSHCRIP